MAKKTESTAVNDLLNLMATEGPRVMDPSADLFAEPPRKMPKGASGMFSMSSPPPAPSKNTRMSDKVAAVQSAGAVDPLPRKRAPHGTQSNTIPAPSRMSTVVPSRDNTIPALDAAPPAPSMLQTPDFSEVSEIAPPPSPTMNVRASRPNLPPPPRTTTSRLSGQHAVPPAPPPARMTGQHAALPPPPPSRTSTPNARLSGQHAVPPMPPPSRTSTPNARLSGQHAVPPMPPAMPRTMTPPAAPRTPTQSLAAQSVGAQSLEVELFGAQPVPPALPDFEVDVEESPMMAKPAAAKPLTGALPTVAPTMSPMVASPMVASPMTSNGAPSSVDMTAGTAWFADSRAVAMQTPFENTSKMHARRSATRELVKKLALPTIAMIVLGGAVGGYIAISRKTTKSTPATPALVATETPVATNTAPVAAPVEQKVVEQQVAAPVEQKVVEQKTETPAVQNVAAPVEQTIETPAPVVTKVALVDVRIDSTPSGAEVTLVDHGKSMFLGSTPISASVDPSKTYEVMLSYPNKPSKMEKLDPKTTTHLAVSFGKGAPIVETAKPAVVAKIAPVVVPAAVVAPKAAPQKQKVEAVAPKTEVAADKPVKAEKTEAKTEPKADKTEAAASEGGEGVLMLGSKPPCEIFVDGKDTGLMTPQRAMKLSVGKHAIRLASPDGEHNKTLSVDIKSDKPTKVIEDLLGL